MMAPRSRQRGLHAELVVVAVKIVNVLRNNVTLEVLPGAGPDANRQQLEGRALDHAGLEAAMRVVHL